MKLIASTTALITSIILFIPSMSSFAKSGTEKECLPLAQVANAHFKLAVQQDTAHWALLSDKIEYKNELWNVYFSAKIDHVSSEAIALEKGKALFAKIPLTDGVLSEWDDCIYYSNASLDLIVLAANPPIKDPVFSHKK